MVHRQALYKVYVQTDWTKLLIKQGKTIVTTRQAGSPLIIVTSDPKRLYFRPCSAPVVYCYSKKKIRLATVSHYTALHLGLVVPLVVVCVVFVAPAQVIFGLCCVTRTNCRAVFAQGLWPRWEPLSYETGGQIAPSSLTVPVCVGWRGAIKLTVASLVKLSAWEMMNLLLGLFPWLVLFSYIASSTAFLICACFQICRFCFICRTWLLWMTTRMMQY